MAVPQSIQANAQRAERAAQILKAVAHPIRLRIIAFLRDGELNVSQLAEFLDVPQPTVSQQLRILRMQRLVEVARENGYSYYRLAEPRLRQLIRCLEGCELH